MIHYLVTRGHDRYTMRRFRAWWAGALRDRIRILPYQRLPLLRAAEPGLWIFSDLERLRPAERAAASALFARLSAAGPAFRALNDPARALTRYELLRAMPGNAFRAWRATEPLDAVRLPAFVRAAVAHDGSLSGLLRDRAEIEPAIRRVLRRRWRLRREDLLVVEFLDTSDGRGIFRKYAAMRIGEALLPRHLFFSRDWVVKKAGAPDEARLREEREFLETFPHRAELRAVFDAARIEYGRIDYAVKDGRIQVWEINTNPVLVPAPRRIAAGRLDRSRRFAGDVIAALRALSDLPAGGLLTLPRAGAAARLAARIPRLPRP
ncbi:MAG TPA: hypothetical protein VFY93_11190 [Planctomycetota bacterium]|nr:hypothetical protein [Planctomycetota bacterium]